MKSFVFLVLLVFLAVTAFISRSKTLNAFPSATPSPSPVLANVVVDYGKRYLDEDELWDTVNNWRKISGFNEFVKSDRLCNVASERIVEVQNDWSHDGFRGTASKIGREGEWIGENLSKHSNDDLLTLNAWLNSPSHKENLANKNFRSSCIKTDGVYAVQIFSNY